MPTLPEALSLAQQALERGDRARAQFIYQQILQAAPEEPNALNGLGTLAYRDGQWDAAENYHRRAIAIFPDEPAFHNNLHLVYLQRGRAHEAVACCRRALELAPDSPELHNNLGVALKETGALAAAVASFERAVQLRPTYADAHYNLANTLAPLHRLEEAESAYRRALQLAPSDGATHNNLGALLQLQGKFSDAMACYEAALHDRTDFAEAHRNRALLRLLLGDFAQGWPEYEWRWKIPGVSRTHDAPPRWEGKSLAGRTVLLECEQGLGDTVQFVRYAPLLQQAGARVILECPPYLHALLKTAPGIDQLVVPGAVSETIDDRLPLLSLPAFFGTTLATIPAPVPYLFAEPERVAHWRRELSDGRELKVGIAWQGNPAFPGDAYRSVPLECFAPLAACDHVKWYSLQKGHGREQLPPLAERLPIVDLGSALDESGGAFVDTAAVMKHLDLVMTSDTSIAHVAGALGVPVWVALPFSPNWRWLLERDDSPWYPTMRLFRQSGFGSWDDVFERLAAELRSLSSRTPLR